MASDRAQAACAGRNPPRHTCTPRIAQSQSSDGALVPVSASQSLASECSTHRACRYPKPPRSRELRPIESTDAPRFPPGRTVCRAIKPDGRRRRADRRGHIWGDEASASCIINLNRTERATDATRVGCVCRRAAAGLGVPKYHQHASFMSRTLEFNQRKLL